MSIEEAAEELAEQSDEDTGTPTYERKGPAHDGQETLDIGENKELKVSGNRNQKQLSVTQTHLGGQQYNLTGLPASGSLHYPVAYDPTVRRIDMTRAGDTVHVSVTTELDVEDMEPVAILDRFGSDALTAEDLREIGAATLLAYGELSPQEEWNAYHNDAIEYDGVTVSSATTDIVWALAHGYMSEDVKTHIRKKWDFKRITDLESNVMDFADENDIENPERVREQ